MKARTTRLQGFTLVELLIVIVIIAIVAAITVVAYNGIQNRANDSAVQSDIRGFAQVIELMNSRDGSYPTGGSATGDSTAFPGVTFKPSKGSYSTVKNNFYYCSGKISGNQAFIIAAQSKSGAVFVYTSAAGSVTKATSGTAYTNCHSASFDAGTIANSYGFYATTQAWWPWTNTPSPSI